jgi:hypothetical protein
MPVEGSIQAEGCSIQVEGFLSSCVAEPSFGHDASREWCAVKAPARRSETTAGRGVFLGASPACQRAGPHRLARRHPSLSSGATTLVGQRVALH